MIGASFHNNTCPYKNFSCRNLAKCSHHAEATMARLSVKSLTFIIAGLLVLLYFYHINSQGSIHQEIRDDTKTSHDRDRDSMSDITCVLSREVTKNIGAKQAGVKKIPCKSDATEVWLPFTFIKNQYEARGSGSPLRRPRLRSLRYPTRIPKSTRQQKSEYHEEKVICVFTSDYFSGIDLYLDSDHGVTISGPGASSHPSRVLRGPRG